MRNKIVMGAFLAVLLTVFLGGCGVPKGEHEKIVKELEQAKKEKAMLNDQVESFNKDRESLSAQLAQSQNQITVLKKENEELKTKLAAKKPAPKTSTAPVPKTPTKKK